MVWQKIKGINLKLLTRLVLCVAFSIFVISGCSKNNESDYVDIGLRWPMPGVELKKIPYRLFDISEVKDVDGNLKKTSDMVGVILDLQSGKAREALILFYVSECFAPEVRNGLPTVMCSVEANGDIFVAGNQQVREQLLRVRADKKIGTVLGRLVGLRHGHPIVQVDTP